MGKIWLIDAGHGGVDSDGIYTTDPSFDPSVPGAGTKCFAHRDGTFIHEGVFNRAVRTEIIKMINVDGGMRWKSVNHGSGDMSLRGRVDFVNNMQNQHGDCVLVSIHGNAGGGNGFEVYTSTGTTQSDVMADVWIDRMVDKFPDRRNRGAKQSNFYLLRKTNCPAILTESFFMDTLDDCRLMNSVEGVRLIACAHFEMMKIVDGWNG
jgi:N-acetylmuramoyl-L-alanine amidase